MEQDSLDAKQLFVKAWASHARGADQEAERLLRRLLELEPEAIETMYSLALVMKSMGQIDEAIRLFEEVVRKIESRDWEDRNRFRMLRRLALGQRNYLQEQDWNLEREVWQ